MTTLPPDLRAAVLEQARRTPSPNASEVGRARRIATLLGAAAAWATVLVLGVSLGGRPMPFVVLSAIGWAAVATAASFVAGARGKAMLGTTRARLAFVAVAAGPVIFAWVMGCAMGWPAVLVAQGTLRAHAVCFALTTLLSIGPVAALAFLRRGSDPVHPRATGAAIGAAAGAWGGVLIDLHCPLVDPMHVALGHVLPIVLYAAIGALAGARLFGVRRSRER